MADDMQTDADPDITLYRKKLIYIDSDITTDNLKCLKFLCLDTIPAAQLEKITQGTALFELLERYQKLGQGNRYFLAECLEKISRRDLSESFLPNAILQLSIEKLGSSIPKFRSILFDISEDLDSDEVMKCMYYFDKIPKSKRGSIMNAMDFFSHLEQVKVIGSKNTDYITEILQTIERRDLVEKLQDYEDSDDWLLKNIRNSPQPAARRHQTDTSKSEEMAAQEKLRKLQLYDDENDNSSLKSPSSFDKLSLSKTEMPDIRDIRTPLLIQVAFQVSANPLNIPVFGKQLGLTETDIYELSHKHKKRPDMIVLTMINKWLSEQSLTDEETNDGLIQAISRSGLSELAQSIAHLLHRQLEASNVETSAPGDSFAQRAHAEVQPSIGSQLNQEENISVTTGEARRINPEENNIFINRQDTDTGRIEEELRRMSLDYQPPQLECYPMTRNPRGFCIIINNEIFTFDPNDRQAKAMKNREGSNLDKIKLIATFKSLNFDVHAFDNLTGVAMVQRITQFSVMKDHTNMDCFVCCILSHGTKDNVYGSDGRHVPIRELTGPLKSLCCPGLLNKPKLFFFQACQGQEKQLGMDLERDAIPEIDVDEDTPSSEVIPNEADFVLGMATIPGFVSYRSKTMGSWYITTLCDVINKYAYDWDMLHLLTQVNNEVGKANANLEGGRYKQSPAPFYTLRKRLIFQRHS